MFKTKWKDEQAVSPVIATILMVAITVVLAGVLVVYMQQFSKGPGTAVPNAGFVPATFTNPCSDSKTMNGGGWAVSVSTISSTTTTWSSVTVAVVQNTLTVYKAVGIGPKTSQIYYNNATGGAANWYAYRNTASGNANYDKTPYTAAKILIPTTTAGVAGVALTELQTAENIYFVVIDNDGGGTVTSGDSVLVFENYAGAATQLVGGTGWQLQLSVSGGTIGSAELA